MRSRTPALAASLTLVGLALTACSGTAASTSSGSSASASPSGAMSTPAPTSSGATDWAVLPESALTPISGLTYTTAAGQDQQIAALGAQASTTSVFSGAVARQLTYQGTTVGGVELFRFRESVPASARASILPVMVGGFAQKAPTAGTMGTTKVQVVEGARGSTIAAVGFTNSRDVVLVWSTSLQGAEKVAATYIQSTPK
jgi:hypothetical protein